MSESNQIDHDNVSVLSETNSHVEDNTLITFSDLKFQVTTLEKKEKIIIKSIAGQYKSGELVALMGPSGAGKTSLMNILCGQNLNYTGNFTLNGQKWKKEFRDIVGFASQHELFFPNQTVEETMMFRATMKLPRSHTSAQIQSRVDDVLKSLRIEHTREVEIGGFAKTLSGGELKRVAVGMELLTNPRILVLDEPTSGLDSSSAFELVDVLKKIAVEQNIVVLISLHQPSMKLFSMFDRATFMRNGNIVYHGEAGDKLNRFVEAIGHPCPTGIGIADHLLELLIRDDLEDVMNEFYQRTLRYDTHDLFYLALEEKSAEKWPMGYPAATRDTPATFSAESLALETKKSSHRPSQRVIMKNLFIRAIKTEARRCYQFADALELAVQLLVQMLIYWQVYDNHDPIDFYSHIGQIFGLTVSLTFKGLFTTLFGELMLRAPVRREIDARLYTHWTYRFIHGTAQTLVYFPWPSIIFFFASFASGLPMSNGAFLAGWLGFVFAHLLGQSIGAVLNVFLPNFGAASDYGVALQLIALITSGNFTSADSIPPFISWMTYLSHIYYAASISMNGMIGMSGMYYDCSTPEDPECRISGEEMLDHYGAELNLGYSILCALIMYALLQLIATLGFRYGKYYNPSK